MPIGFAIHQSQARPAPELIEALRGIPTPILSDNMARLYASGPGLRPMHDGSALLGVAITVRTRPGDNLMVHKAIDLAQPGEAIVVDAGGDLTNAIIGEIMATLAARKGVAGFVIDGSVRDSDALRASSFPIFARGVTHRGPYKDGPGEINGPVSVGGQPIFPGDLIVGDADGVLAIRPADVRAVAELSRAQMNREAQTLAAIADGSLDRSWVDEMLRSRGLHV